MANMAVCSWNLIRMQIIIDCLWCVGAAISLSSVPSLKLNTVERGPDLGG